MWLNLGWLLATWLVVVATLGALSIRLMPPPIMLALGVPCASGSGCVALLPGWAQWGIWSISVVLLTGLVVVGGHSVVTGTRAIVKIRRLALSAGRAITQESWRMGLTSGRLAVLEGGGTFAFTVGLFRPVIVLSNDLMQSLEPRELEAVMAHESAHVAGRDNLILLASRTVARSLWFVPGVGPADRRLHQVVELAADGHARGKVGDGLVVASTLHRFASLMSNRSTRNPKKANPVLAWFSEDGLIVERIGRLLDESNRVVSRVRVRLAFVVLAIVLLAFAAGTYRAAYVNLASGSHVAACAVPGHVPGARVSS